MSSPGAAVRRRLVLGACALALAVLGWRLSAIAMADSLPLDPEAALAWQPDDPFILTELATLAEQSADTSAEAERYARQALAASPLAPDAFRVLASVADSEKDRARARALMRIAGDRWLFDTAAQMWLINDYLASGEFADALYRADAVLRSRPAVRGELLPSMLALAAVPSAEPALLDALSGNPPWRSWFIQQLASGSEDPGRPAALSLALEERGSRPTDQELKPVLLRLLAAGRGDEAFLLWARLLPSERFSGFGNVNNGGFELAPTGLAFDWSLDPVEGASAEVLPSPEPAGGHALRVEFNGRRVPFQHVRQVLMLAPGAYRLSARGRPEEIRNERGFWWQVSCADGRLLGSTNRVSGSAPWTDMTAEFQVPGRGCPTQMLRLSLAARAAVEQDVAGTIWFDDVAISRDPEAAGDPS